MPSASRALPFPTPAAEAPPRGWARTALDGVLGLLGLVWAFAPEIIACLFGTLVGLVLGGVAGAAWTASLFEDGGGAWGRAGPIALLLPVLTFAGPVLLCGLFGATIPSTFTLAVHALVVLGRRDRTTTRNLAVLGCAVGVFVPALLVAAISESHLGGFLGGLAFSAVTGPLAVVCAATYGAVRSILAGRPLATWWRAADGSMGAAMVTASLVAWLGVWTPFAIIVLFPVVVLALLAGVVLALRLLAAGNRVAVVSTFLAVNLLHATLLGWAAAQI